MKSDTDFKIDFVGIGAKKSATTWIYQCLKEHPQICLAPKDRGNLAFFLSENYEDRINNFKLFRGQSGTSKKKGEICIGYLDQPKVITRMRAHNSEIKIVVSLRNPIDRAYSDFLARASSARSAPSEFSQEIKKKDLSEIRKGFYYKHLKEYFGYFSRKNIFVVFPEDIKNDSVKFIKRLYIFLGVDDSFLPKQVSKKVGITSFRLTKFGGFIYLRMFTLMKRLKFLWRLRNVSFIRSLFYRFSEFYIRGAKATKPPMHIEDRRYLYNLYKEDIGKLEVLLCRDLSNWKN